MGLQVLDAPSLPNRLYNLTTAIHTSASQLVAAFQQAYPEVNLVKPIPEDTGSGDMGDMGGMDVSRIKKDLGFEATTDAATGLKAYFQWRIENNFTD